MTIRISPPVAAAAAAGLVYLLMRRTDKPGPTQRRNSPRPVSRVGVRVSRVGSSGGRARPDPNDPVYRAAVQKYRASKEPGYVGIPYGEPRWVQQADGTWKVVQAV